MANLKSNAILNYAENYSSVSEYIKAYNPTVSNGLITAGDFAKIFFTGDGHIVTHGIDYTPDFVGGAKGLVPASSRAEELALNANAKLKFLGNDGNWKELTVAELPIASDFTDGLGNSGSNYIYTAKLVYDFFQSEISALDVMKFLGAFDPENLSEFPKNGKCEKGDTYRATGYTDDFAGFEIHAGDLLICIKDYEGVATADKVDSSEYWMVVEANIDGVASHVVNGVEYEVFTSLQNKPHFDIYAPTTGGFQDAILVGVAEDKAPIWKSVDLLDLINSEDKKKIVSEVSISNDGTFTFTSLGDTNVYSYATEVGTDNWNIDITGKSAGTKNKLTLGDGLKFEGNKTAFDGSVDTKLLLAAATKELIGGVIIDNQAGTVASTESTISVDEDGMIYLTANNIANALGFMPGNINTVFSYKAVITSTNNGTSDATSTNPFFNLIHKQEGEATWSPVSSAQFIGTNGIKIDGQSGKITFDLQSAKIDTLGGIKVARLNASEISVNTSENSTRQDRYYGVELDSNNKAFVYVPWADESYAFSKVVVKGATSDLDKTITASKVDDSFSFTGRQGISINLEDPNNIVITQDVWDVVSSTKMGYAPAMVEGSELTNGHYILSYVTGLAPAWNKLPLAALRDTWRAVQVGGRQLADTTAIDAAGAVVGSAINFTATGDHNKTNITYSASADPTVAHVINISSTWRPMYLASTEIHKDYGIAFDDSDDIVIEPNPVDAENEVQHISFEISWYNISKDAREIVK